MSVSSYLKRQVVDGWGDTVPPGWELRPIKEVLKRVIRPVDLEDEKVYVQPVIRRGHGGLEVRERQRGSEILTKRQFKIRENDWLMSKVQILHRAYGIVPAELDGAIASGSYYAFRPEPELDLDYLWYLSHNPGFHRSCELASVGIVVEKMVFRVKDWQAFEFMLPPLPEQEKIAEILSSVDEAIAATRKVIEQTERVKKGLLQTLMTRGIGHTRFTDADPTWVVGRPPSVADIPVDWRLVRLSEVATLESGHTPARGNPEYWNGDIPWVSLHDTAALKRPEIGETAMSVTAKGIANSSARVLPKGTVVFSRTATIGRCSVLGREMATSQDFANWVCGPSVDARFLMYKLRWMTPVWVALSAGSTHKTVYMPDFKRLQIALPPLDEQREIASIVDSIQYALEAGTDLDIQLHHLKRGLLQDLLTGRVRVPVD